MRVAVAIGKSAPEGRFWPATLCFAAGWRHGASSADFWEKLLFCGSVNVFEARARFSFGVEILPPYPPVEPLHADSERQQEWSLSCNIKEQLSGILRTIFGFWRHKSFMP